MAVARTSEPLTFLSAAPPDAGPRGRGSRTVVLAGALLAAAAAACAVLVVMTLVDLSAAREQDATRTAVLQAARQQAVNFTTLDHRSLDRDLGRVLDGATGQFRTQFESGTKDLAELVTANQAVSEGEVLEAGMVSDDADSARVLVVVDSTVTNVADPAPQKRHYRMQMDLVLQRGHWLVSDLQFVG